MTRHATVALIALMGLGAPALAAAQPADPYAPPTPPPRSVQDYQQCQNQKTGHTVAGALLGGLAGAVLGSQVAGHGARTEGSVLVGGLGALVGAAAGDDSVHCGPSPARQAQREADDPGYGQPGPVDHSYDNMNPNAPPAQAEDPHDQGDDGYADPRAGDAYHGDQDRQYGRQGDGYGPDSRQDDRSYQGPPAYQDNGDQDQDDRSYQDQRSHQDQRSYQDERSYQDRRSYQDQGSDQDAQDEADRVAHGYGDPGDQGRYQDGRAYQDDEDAGQNGQVDQDDQDDHAWQDERGYPDNGSRRPSAERY